MATLLIRSLKDSVKESIRIRAAQHGRSMEAEVRAILEESTSRIEPKEHPYFTIRRAVAKYGGGELDLEPRTSDREPPHFSGDDYKAYGE